MIEINGKWKVSVNLGFREEEKLDLCEMGFRQKESRLFPSGNWWNKGISRKKDPQKSNIFIFTFYFYYFQEFNQYFLFLLEIYLFWICKLDGQRVMLVLESFFFQDNPVLKCMNFVGKRATQLISQVHF